MQNQVEQLLGLYERRSSNRRALVEGLAALVLGSRVLGQTDSSATGVRASALRSRRGRSSGKSRVPED